MATQLKFVSYNCKGFNSSKVNHMLTIISKCDILFVQEHWLFNSQASVFQTYFPDMHSHMVSGMPDTDIMHGRPYGGCAIMWNNTLSCQIVPLQTVNKRLCVVKLNIDSCDYLLCNIYMPTDTTYDKSNLEEFSSVLNDIMCVSCTSNIDHIIVGGDFNTDYLRTTSLHTINLISFMEQNAFVCCDISPQYNVSYTFESDIDGARSHIDHFMVTVNLVESVTKCSVLHDALNLSDHAGLLVEMSINTEFCSTEPPNKHKRLWQMATSDQINEYKSKLDYNLNNVSVPYSAEGCKLDNCNIHQSNIDVFHNDIINACINASDHIPSSKCKAKYSVIPGWNDTVKPYKDRALFWHYMWKENEKPKTGVIADIRRKTRKEYHSAVKRAVNVSKNTRALKFAHKFIARDRRDFWKDVRKTFGSKKSLPCMVDNVNGAEDIAALFQEKYNNLYNSVSYNTNDMSCLTHTIDGMIKNHNIKGICECCTKYPYYVTSVDVSKAVSQLKSSKEDGIEDYSSENIIHGTDLLNSYVSILMNCMLSHGYAPRDFTMSTLIPIPKDKKKSLYDSNNYRAIALSSIIGKLLDVIFISKYKEIFKTSDLQYGFKPCHSTVQSIFVVQEVVQYFSNNKSNVYCALLDASKAFDRVEYTTLFQLLLNRKLCPVVIRLLMSMYTNQTVRVKWGNCISPSNSVTNGVKQGGVLSPILFTIYIDELIQDLNKSCMGCYIGNTFCGAIGYADDIILLSPTVKGINNMLQTCSEYGDTYSVKFNAAKSKLLRFGCSQGDIPNIYFEGDALERVVRGKYLGQTLGNNCDEINMSLCLNDFFYKVNMVTAYFYNVPFHIKYALFKTYCMPLYGAQLWNLGAKQVTRFYVAWRKAIRRLLGLPFTTHCNLLHLICEDIPIQSQINYRCITFINSLSTTNNSITKLCYRLALAGSGSPLSQNIGRLAQTYSTERSQVGSIDKSTVNKEFPMTYNAIINANVVSELLDMKNNNMNGCPNQIFANRQIDIIINDLCTH